MSQVGIRVAVGIPTYNRGHVLLDTLKGFFVQNMRPDEIIVVDQSDWYPDGVRDELARLAEHGSIRYLHQSQPSLPAARNRILNESTADVIIFVDDDVVVPNDFVQRHLDNYLLAGDIVAVAGRVSERLKSRQLSRPRRWRKELDYLFLDLDSDGRRDTVGVFRGCNHSVRRIEALRLGGYDEGFVGVALREEGDLALRMTANGMRIVFDPTASLQHLQSPAGGCRVSSWGDASAAACSLRFAIKHRRHLGWYCWREVLHAYRLGVCNRATIQKPWVLFRRHIWFVVELLRNIRRLPA